MKNSTILIKRRFKKEINRCIFLLEDAINMYELSFEKYKYLIKSLNREMLEKACDSKYEAEQLIESLKWLFLDDNSLLDQLGEKDSDELSEEIIRLDNIDNENKRKATLTSEKTSLEWTFSLKWVFLPIITCLLSVGLYKTIEYILGRIRRLFKSSNNENL